MNLINKVISFFTAFYVTIFGPQKIDKDISVCVDQKVEILTEESSFSRNLEHEKQVCTCQSCPLHSVSANVDQLEERHVTSSLTKAKFKDFWAELKSKASKFAMQKNKEKNEIEIA